MGGTLSSSYLPDVCFSLQVVYIENKKKNLDINLFVYFVIEGLGLVENQKTLVNLGRVGLS